MTAPKHSPLVERVARAIWIGWNRFMVESGLHSQDNGDFDAPVPVDDPVKAKAHRLMREAAIVEAQAAIAACHAEEMREALKAVMAELWWCASQVGFDWKDAERRKVSSVGRAYDRAQALLAKLDGQP